MKRISAILSAAVLLAASTLYAYEPSVFVRGVRPMGMGGAFVALSDDQNAIFYNPAGLTQRQGSQFTLFELPINASDDIFQFYNFYKDNEEHLKNFEEFNRNDPAGGAALLNQINDNMVKYRPNVRFGLPNTSYLSGNGFLSWGFGIFNQEEVGFQFNRAILIPSVSFWGNADLLAAIPLAHRFDTLPYDVPGKLSVGATLKYINRAKIEELNKSVLEFESFDPQLQWGKGFGFDLGTIYQPTDRWNVGLQVTDVGGTTLNYEAVNASEAGQIDKPSYTSMIKPEYNVGTVYTPSKIYYWPGRYINTLDRLQLALDVRDIANSDERVFDATFFKKLHMGAEFRWGPASLRGGINSGYPTFGAGFRIPYLGLKADYAFWGEELGRYAGQIPSWNHQVTLALSWGDSKGKAFGSDVANKSASVVKSKKAKVIEQKTEVVAPMTAAPAAEAQQPAVSQGTTAIAAPAAAPAATEMTPASATPATPAAEQKTAAPATTEPAK